MVGAGMSVILFSVPYVYLKFFMINKKQGRRRKEKPWNGCDSLHLNFYWYLEATCEYVLIVKTVQQYKKYNKD